VRAIQAGSTLLSRRQLLRQLAAAGACLPFCGRQTLALQDPPQIAAGNASSALSADDGNFLEEIEKAHLLYFWEQGNPQTGLVKDRCNVRAADSSIVASIAATGFGLTALCIADKHGYVSPADARNRVLTTLRFIGKKLPTHRGFFYHFANANTGERIWDSEVSSVDTAILLAGMLMCRQHFDPHSEISALAYEIFNRVDWTWLAEDTSVLSHGWTPESGFLPSRWDYYSELMMMYLLGLGSFAHPLQVEVWNAWKRTVFEYDGLRYIGSFAPLFVHQYSQAWFDFRGKRDKYADYFENSAIATEAHWRFCVGLAKRFSDYSDDLWGITASDSQNGYVIWGGPPALGPIDGTVVPCAAGGSLPFLPAATIRVLRNIRNNYPSTWSRYGFVDAFNPMKKWYNSYVIGIDAGITMLMAENLRTGFVWETFMKNPEATRGMQRAGFHAYTGTPPQATVPSRDTMQR
jgi:hypothetical protein